MTDELGPRDYGRSRARHQPPGPRARTRLTERYDGYDGDRFDRGAPARGGAGGSGWAPESAGYGGGHDAGYGRGDYGHDGYDPEPTGGFGHGGYDPQPGGGFGHGGYDPQPGGGFGRGGYDPEPTGGFGHGGYDPEPSGGFGRGGYDPEPSGGYRRGGYDRGGFDPNAPTSVYPGYSRLPRGGDYGPDPDGGTGGFARVFGSESDVGLPGWEEETGTRRRGSGRKGRSPRKRGRRVKTTIALIVTLALLGGLAGAAWYGLGRIRDFFTVADYNTGGSGSVTVEIKKNQLIADMAQTLAAKDVVKSPKAFVNAARDNPKSRTIEPGLYKLRQKMRAADALGMLLARNSDGKLVNKLSSAVTIPEGRSAKQTLAILAKQTKLPLADFQKAAKDPVALGVPAWWFKRQDGKPSAKSIEGFLFPSTYEFEPNATATDILKQMVAEFLTVTGEMKFADRVQAERKVSPYEALIVASLAQAEAGNADDLGKVARVAYNRAYSGTFPCSCLQFDVTVNYWLELQGRPTKPSKDMTPQELNDPRNPYSGAKAGLPPGPIDNPGKAALVGAMSPPKGTWLYFVAIDKQGHSAFATTLAEHQRNEQKACAAKITC